MYVDESGDPGVISSPTRWFTLTGLVVHELQWQAALEHTIAFRRHLSKTYGIHATQEIHAAQFVANPGRFAFIPRHERLAVIREYADFLVTMPYINLINVVVDKRGKPPEYDAFDKAWQALLQRFENTLTHQNFPGAKNLQDRGMLFPDNTDGRKLRMILRKMRRYNPVPS